MPSSLPCGYKKFVGVNSKAAKQRSLIYTISKIIFYCIMELTVAQTYPEVNVLESDRS
jgi:hypothetical protein